MNDEKITLDLVIDVQKDFITGALANTQAQANVAHLAETARAHAQAGHWMFFTRDTHQDNYLTTREGRSLPIEHCIEGEDGWNFAPELENVMADTEPFEEKMTRLTGELSGLFEKSHELEAEIKKQLGSIGYKL